MCLHKKIRRKKKVEMVLELMQNLSMIEFQRKRLYKFVQLLLHIKCKSNGRVKIQNLKVRIGYVQDQQDLAKVFIIDKVS